MEKSDRCMIIAEISANHGQDYKRAVKLIKKAKECGADAVKFQAINPDTITLDMDNKYFRLKHKKWGGQTLYQLYQKAHIPWEWLGNIKELCDSIGIMFFCSVFDEAAVDFCEKIDVPFYKISSFELTDLNLINCAAGTGKKIILSTGMATDGEIRDAVKEIRKTGNKDMALLKCISSYPVRPEFMNLSTIRDMEKRFKVPVGLSDHSLDRDVPVIAVSLGAKIIEKHFTLSRKDNTLDNFFSMEPSEFKDLVKSVRKTEQILGDVFYGVTKEEEKSVGFRRSLFAVKDIKKGEKISKENVRVIRPGFGMKPKKLKNILNKKAKKSIKKGTPVLEKMIEE